jgi:hypothetical protein
MQPPRPRVRLTSEVTGRLREETADQRTRLIQALTALHEDLPRAAGGLLDAVSPPATRTAFPGRGCSWTGNLVAAGLRCQQGRLARRALGRGSLCDRDVSAVRGCFGNTLSHTACRHKLHRGTACPPLGLPRESPREGTPALPELGPGELPLPGGTSSGGRRSGRAVAPPTCLSRVGGLPPRRLVAAAPRINPVCRALVPRWEPNLAPRRHCALRQRRAPRPKPDGGCR